MICDQLGEEPDPERLPVERSNFPLEVQQAFQLWDLLSDRWEGMSGFYLGKDYSGLQTYIDILEINDPLSSIYFLKHIDALNSDHVNKKIQAKRDAEERKAKMKR